MKKNFCRRKNEKKKKKSRWSWRWRGHARYRKGGVEGRGRSEADDDERGRTEEEEEEGDICDVSTGRHEASLVARFPVAAVLHPKLPANHVQLIQPKPLPNRSVDRANTFEITRGKRTNKPGINLSSRKISKEKILQYRWRRGGEKKWFP